ncbi:MAG: Hpt domain-containing protein [Oscillospiraceae bacterium]|nr:Hpt domain-containing protein [Oscillospiraceae bacterium]
MGNFLDEKDAMARLGNNKKLYAMLLKKFNGDAMLEELKNKLADGDAGALQAQAHTIKGLAANLSLQDLKEKSEAIESAVKNSGSTEGIDISEITVSITATNEAVSNWLSENA